MLMALVVLPDNCACLRPGPGPKRSPDISRRAAGCGLVAAALASSQSSLAFDNGVPEMARFKNEKKSGVDIPLYTPNNKKPLSLQDNGKLATCNDDPNCFSTSGGSRNLLEVWYPKAGDAQAGDAMGELLATLKAYPPGQSGACVSPGGSSSCIDGGGFQIVSSTPSYLYVQFESLKYVPHGRSRTVHVPAMCPCASPASYCPLSCLGRNSSMMWSLLWMLRAQCRCARPAGSASSTFWSTRSG